MNNTNTAAVQFEAARKAIAEGEAAGLSERTMSKRWKTYFAAEDALRSQPTWK